MSLWRWLTYPLRPGPRRPLSYRQPKPVDAQRGETPLGLEAVDMSVIDSVNRRNASLERVNAPMVPARHATGFFTIADTPVAPLKDDETYAARYHRAYNQKKGTSK